ncbi:MAG: hypothetical protein O2812_05215 [Chloroflexi bacterium]|nr:hypothetical protein [Chloroflexota bacterium]
MQKIAWALVIVGSAVLLGYAGYYSIDAFFRASDVPIAVKIAAPVAVFGVIMLAAMIVRDRLAEKDKEDFRKDDK